MCSGRSAVRRSLLRRSFQPRGFFVVHAFFSLGLSIRHVAAALGHLAFDLTTEDEIEKCIENAALAAQPSVLKGALSTPSGHWCVLGRVRHQAVDFRRAVAAVVTCLLGGFLRGEKRPGVRGSEKRDERSQGRLGQEDRGGGSDRIDSMKRACKWTGSTKTLEGGGAWLRACSACTFAHLHFWYFSARSSSSASGALG